MALTPKPVKSAFESHDALSQLMRTGHVDGLFPQHHIVRHVTRVLRFASASYGARFMRVMGITTASGCPAPGIDKTIITSITPFLTTGDCHHLLYLLSPFVDPRGRTDASGEMYTGVPMVHFISLDRESQSDVLTCRETLWVRRRSGGYDLRLR
jgi:hypothetical protein